MPTTMNNPVPVATGSGGNTNSSYYPIHAHHMRHGNRMTLDDESIRQMVIGSLSRSLNSRHSMSPSGMLLETYYNIHLSGRSPSAGFVSSPSADLAQFAGLEDKFCKDFSCCGVQLSDLHDLLQHFEENHVKLESDMDEDESDDDLPFEFECVDEMDLYELESGEQFDSLRLSTGTPGLVSNQAMRSHPASPTASVALSDIYTQDGTHGILRVPTPSHPSLSRRKHEHATTIPPRFDGPTRLISNIEVDEDGNIHHHGTDLPVQGDDDMLVEMDLMMDLSHEALVSLGAGLPTIPEHEEALHAHGILSHVSIPPEAVAPTPAPQPHRHVLVPKIKGVVITETGETDDRPYKCKFDGCDKAYKNPGGLKYHYIHGHAEDTGDPEMNHIIHRPYHCVIPECDKRYKNMNGLKYHMEHSHNMSVPPNYVPSPAPQPQIPFM